MANGEVVGMFFNDQKRHSEKNLSIPCPDCGGEGEWYNNISSVEMIRTIEKCPSCINGYSWAICKKCNSGHTSNGETCKTCSGTGKFIFYPTRRFPHGILCGRCKGVGVITKIKQKVVTCPPEQIICQKCRGMGELFILQDEYNNDDVQLIKIVDKILNLLIPSESTVDSSSIES